MDAPPDPPSSLTAAAERALSAVLDAWRVRYGQVVADVWIVAGDGEEGGGPTLRGSVLVPAQRDALVRSMAAQLTSAGHDPRRLGVAVVALTERERADGWLRGAKGLKVAVRSTIDGALATELLPSDAPARLLAVVDGHAVIEMADRTVGWVRRADVDSVPDQHAPASVAAWRAGWAGAARAATPEAWAAAVQPWLGAPYALGGRSAAGIDCSAFVQHVVKTVTGLGLPRHSTDQARFGLRVALADVDVGDCFHLTHLERGTSHVAVALGPRGRGALAAHACLDHQQVCVETLDGLLSRYAFRAARRFPAGYRPT